MSACWRQVTVAPREPIVRSAVKLQDPDIVVVVVLPVVTGAVPVSEAWTLAIVVESAPNDWSKDTMAWTWAEVSVAASATWMVETKLNITAAATAAVAMIANDFCAIDICWINF